MSNYIYKIVPKRAGFAESWTPEEETVMAQHFQYLKQLLANGALVLAGPCTDAAFGIVIIEAESSGQATEIAKADPAIAGGVMSYELHDFRISLFRSGF